MADGEINLTAAAGPRPGEQVWGPSMPVASQAVGPTQAPSVPQRGIAGQVADIGIHEAITEPVMSHVIAPMLGEPVTAALSLAMLAMELADLTRSVSPAPTAPAGPAQQVWGPAGPEPRGGDRACCRQAAQYRQSCPVHGGPAGPG